MRSNIGTLEHSRCCGCKACGDVCPSGAISFHTDEEGFFYPSVGDGCVECGLCVKVCPASTPLRDYKLHEQSFIGCLDKNKERRDTGSSGGIFGLLASKKLAENFLVCGAAFDEELKLCHILVDNEKDLGPLKKSKYLQSDCNGIYKRIKECLASGRKVMFVGTPCQCDAIRHYFRGKEEKLLLVDFACHGVPSQELFDRCKQYYEENHQCKVKSFSFRYKPKQYGSPQNFLLLFDKDGKRIKRNGPYYKYPFYCGFQKYITLRPSCYTCQWAKTERVSDITLADFWGVELATEKWDRTDTPSLVIINSERGKQLFQEIEGEIDFFLTDREHAVRRNGSLIKSTSLKKERQLFFADMQSLPFQKVVERYLSVRRSWAMDIYYAVPFSVRKFFLKFLNKL